MSILQVFVCNCKGNLDHDSSTMYCMLYTHKEKKIKLSFQSIYCNIISFHQSIDTKKVRLNYT